LGKNIHAVEVEGTFDDCQRIVKEALQSNEIQSQHPLTSANSINIARLLPQMLYYLHAWLALPAGKHPVFSVPSGNLGNLTGGLLAHRLGMPVTKFIAACNSNDVFTEYLESGVFTPRTSEETHSNAMDVGNPSNFSRIDSLFNGDLTSLRSTVAGYRCSDSETIEEIRHVKHTCDYILDPHTAVGTLALKQFLRKHSLHPSTAPGIVLATAHPAKFASTISLAVGAIPELPVQLRGIETLPTHKSTIPATLSAVRELLNQT
jgi:threonine synthase